jgi:hypothetical protein
MTFQFSRMLFRQSTRDRPKRSSFQTRITSNFRPLASIPITRPGSRGGIREIPDPGENPCRADPLQVRLCNREGREDRFQSFRKEPGTP